MNSGNAEKGRNLQSQYEFNSRWGDRIARLILLGLAVDIFAAFILGKSALEIVLTIVANALIFAGVWGELWFEKRAKAAGDGLVAEANARAAEAQLQLAKMRSTRRQDLVGNESVIAEKIALFPGTQFDAAVGMGDGEQADFIWDLEIVLSNAGWRQIAWFATAMGPNLVIHRGSSQRPTLGNVSALGVEIHLAPSARSALLPAANALILALNDAGIVARDSGYNIMNGNTNAVHILIGPKR